MIAPILAVLPLIVVFFGIVFLRRSGAEMAVVGLVLVLIIAKFYFDTPLEVGIAASIYGLLKSLGITLAVVWTMFMIFLMREVGALDTISSSIKKVAETKEEQALWIGIAFGSLVTSLGVVTPSMLPPLLVAMGFSPFSAVTISVLGYNATTSFALLSIPITLPAEAAEKIVGYEMDPGLFAYKVCIYLPVVSLLISVAMILLVKGSLRKSLIPTILTGLSLGISALIFSLVEVPVMLIGVLSGLVSMLLLHFYMTRRKPWISGKILRAASPWIILITLALIVSYPEITSRLKEIDPPVTFGLIANQSIDFNVFAQIYTWILVATISSIPILKPSKEQLIRVTNTWLRRIWGPVIAYSLFFSIAYVMAWSSMHISGGKLVPSPRFDELNMNKVIGLYLAEVLGNKYLYFSAFLGLFGAVVSGSETGSNVMFLGIQYKACENLGITQGGFSNEFMTVFGAHANAGGVASAITPSKINNAVATIGERRELEGEVMRKLTPVVIGITLVVGVLTSIFVKLGI